ncbi:hypothetical protein SAMN05877838_0920 [Hoeflea halophila]|uniref:Uncharacterized protein n=1 Tax=Hoeflea halophila TaxID=714899 RepID=A0A286HZT5_9HYPH|nr:hypothetical protein [Hoeflea halophila]SOE13355.1 hypothetical protein SAMN05877838_0920 [Hoeflea halophila]
MRRDFLIVLVITALLPGVAMGDIATANDRAKSGTFDATGEVRCAQEVGQPLEPCSADVARAEDAAAVVVRFPNGFARSLMFSDRAFLRGNATMSGTGTDMDWRLSGGMFHVRVDDQRFEIPETLVFGD